MRWESPSADRDYDDVKLGLMKGINDGQSALLARRMSFYIGISHGKPLLIRSMVSQYIQHAM